jgi:hypothetical protein
MQEQRLLAEERQWRTPEVELLQAKVQQLYRLDVFLQEESLNMQTLQQDKALLQRALGGLRHKIAAAPPGPEAERFRHQERLLERELSRVCHLVAANAQVLYIFFVYLSYLKHAKIHYKISAHQWTQYVFLMIR